MATLLAFTAVGHLPSWGPSPNASARTGPPPNLLPSGLPPYAVLPYENGHAATPPMGWNPYNHWGRSATADTVRAMALALVTSGMRALGYTYVNLDGGWDELERNSQGELQPNAKKFPQGIKPVADYVHSLGLRFGIYASAGYRNCANTSAGSYGHYQQDANTFASWGVDYVKLDWCWVPKLGLQPSDDQVLAKEFGDALRATGRMMVLDLNDWSDELTARWAGDLGNLWRTARDIRDSYPSMVANFQRDVAFYMYARPDGWNDPDMLEVGNHGMSFVEQRTQFTLWSELAAPLIAGTDLTQMSHDALEILTNPDVIAVDQDPLGAQGYPVTSRDMHWVITKPLANGDRAVVLFDQKDQAATIQTTVGAIGLSGAGHYQLRDLWTGAVTTTTGPISALVPPHGAVMFLVSPLA